MHPYSLVRRILCITALLFCGLLSEGHAEERTFYGASVDLQAGYRRDNLDWNIAGSLAGTNPNILSELSWNDLDIFQVGISLRAAGGPSGKSLRSYLRSQLCYGWILDGDNRDSDYGGDNRTLEWSRSNNNGDDGSVIDAKVGGGIQILSPSRRIKFTPLIGYSYHEQNLTLTDGFQTLSEPDLAPPGSRPAPLGAFSGLDSTFETQWYGPWVGIDVEFVPSGRCTLLGGVEVHFAEYEAEANWNLINRFAHPKSFEHEADDARGLVLYGEGRFEVSQRVELSLVLAYQDWTADDGIDRVFFSNDTIGITRLNEVNWDSYSISLGVVYQLN